MRTFSLFVFVCLSLLFIHCSNHDDYATNAPEPTTYYLPTQISYINQDNSTNSIQINLTYNEKRQLTFISSRNVEEYSEHVWQISYTANNRIQEVDYNQFTVDNPIFPFRWEIYTLNYNDNQNLSSITIKNVINGFDGNIPVDEQGNNLRIFPELENEQEYLFNSNNVHTAFISNTINYTLNLDSDSLGYFYDAQIPKEIYPLIKIRYFTEPMLFLSKKNIVSINSSNLTTEKSNETTFTTTHIQSNRVTGLNSTSNTFNNKTYTIKYTYLN